jgi:hypothetical protein
VPPVPTLLSPPLVTRRLLSDAPFMRDGDGGSVGEGSGAGISLRTNGWFAEIADFGPLGERNPLSGDVMSALPSEVAKCVKAAKGQEENWSVLCQRRVGGFKNR